MKTNDKIIDSCFVQPKAAFEAIKRDWKAWVKTSKIKKYVVGISGGVDSSCAAALAVKIFGKENVVGVLLPKDEQKDISYSRKLVEHLGIKSVEINIGDACYNIEKGIDANALPLTEQCTINLPARIRMATLFAVGQSVGAGVLNTSNRSESCVGYDTIFGDDCGCYSPFKNLVKTEIIALAEWLGLPKDLAHKAPSDGLQPLTDEERFGFTYAELDTIIRGIDTTSKLYKKVEKMYLKNKFKLDIVDLPGPDFSTYADVFRDC